MYIKINENIVKECWERREFVKENASYNLIVRIDEFVLLSWIISFDGETCAAIDE